VARKQTLGHPFCELPNTNYELCGKNYSHVSNCRVLDPHSQLTSRRRSASVNSRDHHLGSLAEDPAEEDQVHDTDSETVNSGGCVQFSTYLYLYELSNWIVIVTG
jgi:hypothetical protein